MLSTTYAEFHRDGKIIDARLLCDSFAPRDTREVDESWLHDAFLTLHGLDDGLSKSTDDVSESDFLSE